MEPSTTMIEKQTQIEEILQDTLDSVRIMSSISETGELILTLHLPEEEVDRFIGILENADIPEFESEDETE